MRENNKLLSIVLALSLSTGTILPVCLTGCGKKVEEPSSFEQKIEEKAAAKEIRAEDDFYGYVNAEALRKAEIDPTYGMAGSFLECEIKKEQQLDMLIDNIVSSGSEYAPGSNEQLIRDYYKQVKEYDDEKSTADQEVMGIIKDIFEVRSTSDLFSMAARLIRSLNVDPFFGFQVFDSLDKPTDYSLVFTGYESVLGVPLEEIRSGEEGRFKLNSIAYNSLIACGYEEAEAKTKADDLTKLAIDLSVNYEATQMSLENVKTLSSAEMKEYIDTDAFTEAMGFTDPYGKWYLMNERAFADFSEIWKNEDHLEALKTWLAMSVLQNSYSYLSSKEVKDVYGESTMDKEKYAKQMVKNNLSTQLGELYAEAFYTEETDRAVRDMCEKIRASYREVIAKADWLSEETRAGLLRKLENLQFITGAGITHEIDPKDAELIGKDAWETMKNMYEKFWSVQIGSLKTERPRQGQSMDPQTVNACYWVDNVVRITIAIVNEPFFYEDGDPSANLGGLGMVIGHEVGHAFDSNGLAWDENGVYNPEWIPEADRQALKERSEKCIEYYNGYAIMGIYHVDGKLTLSENFADLGSMEIITNIAKTKEERRALFENYAKIWQALQSDVSGISSLKQDAHSPDMIRVNAVLSSCEAFYETYDVKEGDGMYVAPEKRVSRW